MVFTSEAAFEEAVIAALKQHGWDDAKGVLKHPTEQDLIDNWASILFENNRGVDRLNGQPLTRGEMSQIIEQVVALRTPLKLNGFINGKTVAITRDNPNDSLHFGKEVSLKIYDRHEIAAGQSRYQIAQQPEFQTAPILNNRRGDLMLLINGMPVIHIELKRSGIPVSQACHQIAKYMHEGVFSRLFSLVQIFVGMTPEETLYFANPGPEGAFNPNYYFHWADFNNEPINDWARVCSQLLSIPMAHQLIGFYTVADESDGVLKVMRSYQYQAASRISDRAAKTKWGERNPYGGFIWHTTGSGKTMTSFKSAQLIANAGSADKVVFLVDRIELGTQSLREYRAFADNESDVQATEDTGVLISRLRSDDPADTLIVTSIQKMSRVKDGEGHRASDLKAIRAKRVAFIVDECHRSVFGDMLADIRSSFPEAIFFGFTGTPIQEENKKNDNTTAMVFGDELHRYSIADGIRDGNVLGFDPYRVCTFKDEDLREQVALMQAHAANRYEAMEDPKKADVFFAYMDTSNVQMAGHFETDGSYEKGIEDYIPNAQYLSEEHCGCVVDDIVESFPVKSLNGKFHALFATNSIAEAIEYYRRFKKRAPWLKVTALFDPNIDNNEGAPFKEDGLVEIIQDYNARYGKDYTLGSHGKFKRDIASRLAHKDAYRGIEKKPEEQIDILIVVDQMLTGFDSKWINTLYLDKLMQYESIIQAFSRTNRLFGNEKPHGTIKYYRRPHTMERNVKEALRLYSGDRPLALFVQKLDFNLERMNLVYRKIVDVFEAAGVTDLAALPEQISACGEFASLFKELNEGLDAARVQGFNWDTAEYEFEGENPDDPKRIVEMGFDENDYLTLAQRYKELAGRTEQPDDNGGDDPAEAPFDIVGYLTEIDTGRINADYMNDNFEKWLKVTGDENASAEENQRMLEQLHKSFAYLPQEQQLYAEMIIHDVLNGDLLVEEGKTFRDYINEYQAQAEDGRVVRLVEALGVDRNKLLALMKMRPTADNINEFGRFDELIATADRDRAKAFFELQEGRSLPLFKVNIRLDTLLRRFVVEGGFDID